MTETREQWIEREAQAARARYWHGGYTDWASLPESRRDDWRRVVAPYYPEPVADADTLEKLAEIAEEAYKADKSNLVDEKWISATKAILRAAKPYYSPRGNDLDSLCRNHGHDSRAFADFINSRIRYRFELSQPKPTRAPVDVDGLARAMRASYANECHDCAPNTFDLAPFMVEARAALAYLNIEPCAAPEYNPDDVAFRDALKKSQEIVNNWTPEQRNHNSIGYAGLQDNERNELANLREEVKRLRHQLDIKREAMESMLAEISKLDAERGLLRSAHAVIDAPAGVPSVDELANICCGTPGGLEDGLAAVRDAILAGVQQPHEWAEDAVEELAKVLYEAPDADSVVWPWRGAANWEIETMRNESRAALAWFDGKRGVK